MNYQSNKKILEIGIIHNELSQLHSLIHASTPDYEAIQTLTHQCTGLEQKIQSLHSLITEEDVLLRVGKNGDFLSLDAAFLFLETTNSRIHYTLSLDSSHEHTLVKSYTFLTVKHLTITSDCFTSKVSIHISVHPLSAVLTFKNMNLMLHNLHFTGHCHAFCIVDEQSSLTLENLECSLVCDSLFQGINRSRIRAKHIEICGAKHSFIFLNQSFGDIKHSIMKTGSSCIQSLEGSLVFAQDIVCKFIHSPSPSNIIASMSASFFSSLYLTDFHIESERTPIVCENDSSIIFYHTTGYFFKYRPTLSYAYYKHVTEYQSMTKYFNAKIEGTTGNPLNGLTSLTLLTNIERFNLTNESLDILIP